MPAHDPAALALLNRLGGARLVNRIIDLFVETGPRRVAEAKKAHEAGDARGVSAAAHSLKSSAWQLGSTRLAAACQTIETLADTGDLAGAAAHFAELESACTEACDDLARHRAS